MQTNMIEDRPADAMSHRRTGAFRRSAPSPTPGKSRNFAQRVFALAAASAVIAGSLLSSPAQAADPVGTIATVFPETGFSSTFTGNVVTWGGSLYANRAAVGYTAWPATGAASSFVPATLPVVAVSAVLGPNLISIAPSGQVYSTNANSSVTDFGAPSVIAIGGSGLDFSVTADGGNLWISRGNVLKIHTPNATSLGTSIVVGQTGVGGTFPPGATLRSVKGPDNNMWVAMNRPGAVADVVFKYDLSGNLLTAVPLNITLGNLADPLAIAADATAVWVAETGNFVNRIDASSTPTRYPLTAGTTPGLAPVALAAGPDGGMWIAEAGSSTVSRLSVTGSTFARQDFAVPGGGTFGLRGLSTGPDGNMWAIGLNTAAKFGTVATTPPAFTAQTPTLTATVGTAYTNYTFTATGAPAPTFTVDTGALPAGMSLTPAGVLSGTPTSAGTFTFTVKASNGVGTAPVSGSIVLVVSPVAPTTVPPSFPTTLPNSGTGVIGQPFTAYTFVASGTPAPTFSIVGTPPPGLTLSPAGVFSGTPTTAGTYTFSVKASNGTTDAVSPLITVVIADPTTAPVFTSLASPATPVVGSPYAYTFTAAGTPTPSFTSTGTLPPGLSLSASGVLGGTPTTVGTYTFTVKATNGKSPDAQISVTITVTSPSNAGGGSSGGNSGGSTGGGSTGGSSTGGSSTGSSGGSPVGSGGGSGVAPKFGAVPLPTRATAGKPFAPYQYNASGTPAIISFSATGTLPPGLVLSPTGLLSGTPTVAGTFNFSVRASNGTAPDAELAGAIIIEPRGTKVGFRCTATKPAIVKIDGIKTKVTVCKRQVRITA